MKKIYILTLAFLCFFASSQPFSSLLQNTTWTIMKIQWNGVSYNPPSPLMQSGKVAFNHDENNGFKSSFFNTATGKVTFGENNATYFTVQNIAQTLLEYSGENQQAVRDFDDKVTDFYFAFQASDQFTFEYEQIFSGRNLVVTNKNGNKIFYSNLILGTKDETATQSAVIYPNPAKNEFFFQSRKSTSGEIKVEILDTSGRNVSTQKVKSTDAINTQSLKNGVYLIKVTGAGKNSSTKLTIKK